MSTPEKEFITKFISLASLKTSELSAESKKPLHDVTNLGVALPALRYKYDHKRAKRSALSGSASATIELRLKSIRAPKFSYSREFSTSQTIYQVKQYLVEAEESIVDSSQIKVLLKGKVLHENVLLSDLRTTEADLVVMVSKLDTPAPIPQPARADTFQVPWTKIQALLQGEVADPKDASTMLERLKQGWHATEPSDLD
ncbi:LANO_0H01112g1_1 [Lachancea nothofagi CBS 11611]|uniref:LANO_0H01112g1_1 n=1 Tax=Lachancea nothofagi CBS 11611 TaxID=1266666 RepID=A0A1G4KKX8_9SACH|nr:LANO_0H01112g1_1 [Lachancea nothofagi CBS 11611]